MIIFWLIVVLLLPSDISNNIEEKNSNFQYTLSLSSYHSCSYKIRSISFFFFSTVWYSSSLAGWKTTIILQSSFSSFLLSLSLLLLRALILAIVLCTAFKNLPHVQLPSSLLSSSVAASCYRHHHRIVHKKSHRQPSLPPIIREILQISLLY